MSRTNYEAHGRCRLRRILRYMQHERRLAFTEGTARLKAAATNAERKAIWWEYWGRVEAIDLVQKVLDICY